MMACERCVYGTGKHAEWCHPHGSLPSVPTAANLPIKLTPNGMRWVDPLGTYPDLRTYLAV